MTNRALAPPPPDGEGPLLEWFKPSLYGDLVVLAWGIPFCVLSLTAEQGGSTEWMQFWWIWVFFVLLLLGVNKLVRPIGASAGAEWLQVKKNWVRLYELIEVKAEEREQHVQLDLKDSAGRAVRVRANDLQKDPDLWDLVYNGILHSVIAGNAETNRPVHGSVRIPRQKPHWMR